MKITFSKIATNQLQKLKKSNQSIYERVMKKIVILQNDELIGIKLKGVGDIYKIRIGGYRILYETGKMLIVQILRVDKRGRVYRKIK